MKLYLVMYNCTSAIMKDGRWVIVRVRGDRCLKYCIPNCITLRGPPDEHRNRYGGGGRLISHLPSFRVSPNKTATGWCVPPYSRHFFLIFILKLV